MNLKRQLLLVSVLALVLPWAGYQFIHETESALRRGQQQMLAGTARAIADSLAQYPGELPDTQYSAYVHGDQLYGHRLETRPEIDGYFQDWTLERESLRTLRGTDGSIRFAIGAYEQALYLYVEVTDKNVVFARPGTIALDDSSHFADRVSLINTSPLDLEETITFAAEAPGLYVECAENFTAETMGPVLFRDYLLPVYERAIPLLHQAGKVVGTHFDGRLAAARDVISESSIDHIESLTEPPEGDMTLAQCRAAWPDKGFWSNVNVGLFELPLHDLRAEMERKIEEGSVDGARLAFEISEDLPQDWKRCVPEIMDLLGYHV